MASFIILGDKMTAIFNNVNSYDEEIIKIDTAIRELEETKDSAFYNIPDEKMKKAVIERRDAMLNDLKGLKGLFVYQKAAFMTEYYERLLSICL